MSQLPLGPQLRSMSQRISEEFISDIFPDGAEQVSDTLYKDHKNNVVLSNDPQTNNNMWAVYRPSLLHEIATIHDTYLFLRVKSSEYPNNIELPYSHTKFSILVPVLYGNSDVLYSYGPIECSIDSPLPRHLFNWVNNEVPIMLRSIYDQSGILVPYGYVVVNNHSTSPYNGIGKEIHKRLWAEQSFTENTTN